MSTTNPSLPWEYHTDLSADRLKLVASLLAHIHNEVLLEHNPDKGDTSWGLGCRAYDRSRTNVIRIADQLDWLEITDNSKHLVFQIGEVPARFCKGDEDGSPNDNVLFRKDEEIEAQQQAFFGFFGDMTNRFWRFIIVKDPETLEVVRVEFNLVNDVGDVFCRWNAPIDGDVSHLLSSDYQKEAPQDVEDPSFGVDDEDSEAGAVS